jgi:hypothetical protein
MPLSDYVDPIPPAIDHRIGDTATVRGTVRTIADLAPAGHYRITLDVDTTEAEQPARGDAPAGTAQHLAHQITDDIVGRHEAEGYNTDHLDRDLIDAAILEGFLGALAVTLDRDAIRKAITDAYYDTRNASGTMETAADRAADAVLEVIRG